MNRVCTCPDSLFRVGTETSAVLFVSVTIKESIMDLVVVRNQKICICWHLSWDISCSVCPCRFSRCPGVLQGTRAVCLPVPWLQTATSFPVLFCSLRPCLDSPPYPSHFHLSHFQTSGHLDCKMWSPGSCPRYFDSQEEGWAQGFSFSESSPLPQITQMHTGQFLIKDRFGLFHRQPFLL